MIAETINASESPWECSCGRLRWTGDRVWSGDGGYAWGCSIGCAEAEAERWSADDREETECHAQRPQVPS